MLRFTWLMNFVHRPVYKEYKTSESESTSVLWRAETDTLIKLGATDSVVLKHRHCLTWEFTSLNFSAGIRTTQAHFRNFSHSLTSFVEQASSLLSTSFPNDRAQSFIQLFPCKAMIPYDVVHGVCRTQCLCKAKTVGHIVNELLTSNCKWMFSNAFGTNKGYHKPTQ
jgi:hypothetical protein